MLPDYVPWFGPELQRVLTAETRWRAPADALHFDCRGVPFSSWLERRKYGLSQQDITYSAWIRDGLLSRQQALAALGTETDVEPEGWGEFLAELGLSRTEVRWDGRWHPQRLDSVL
jgi:hypothetical protein